MTQRHYEFYEVEKAFPNFFWQNAKIEAIKIGSPYHDGRGFFTVMFAGSSWGQGGFPTFSKEAIDLFVETVGAMDLFGCMGRTVRVGRESKGLHAPIVAIAPIISDSRITFFSLGHEEVIVSENASKPSNPSIVNPKHQEMLELAILGVLEQGGPSTEQGTPSFMGEQGRRCPGGFILPDDCLVEGFAIDQLDVPEEFEPYVSFIEELVEMHDMHASVSRDQYLAVARNFAEEKNLDFTPISKWLEENPQTEWSYTS